MQLEAGGNPIFCPSQIALGFQNGKGAERRTVMLAGNVVVLTAARLGGGEHPALVVEGPYPHPLIPQGLHRYRAQERGFPGPCWAEDETMSDVAIMQVQPERRAACRSGMQERRRTVGVVGAGTRVLARPHARQGQ